MRRATCGESAVSPHLGISIHALHEESDCREALQGNRDDISIHALHEESDSTLSAAAKNKMDFNPRSP